MTVARDQLRAFVERIERTDGEIKALNTDKRDIYAEAKGNGFDVKALRAVIAMRRKSATDREEHDAIVQTYMVALGMAPDFASRVHAHEAHPNCEEGQTHDPRLASGLGGGSVRYKHPGRPFEGPAGTGVQEGTSPRRPSHAEAMEPAQGDRQAVDSGGRGQASPQAGPQPGPGAAVVDRHEPTISPPPADSPGSDADRSGKNAFDPDAQKAGRCYASPVGARDSEASDSGKSKEVGTYHHAEAAE